MLSNLSRLYVKQFLTNLNVQNRRFASWWKEMDRTGSSISFPPLLTTPWVVNTCFDIFFSIMMWECVFSCAQKQGSISTHLSHRHGWNHFEIQQQPVQNGLSVLCVQFCTWGLSSSLSFCMLAYYYSVSHLLWTKRCKLQPYLHGQVSKT